MLLLLVACGPNTAPVITSASISPDPLRTNDVASYTAAVEDENDDEITLTVTWVVDGQTYSGETLDGAQETDSGTRFERGQVVQAIIEPSDGRVRGRAFATAPVEVINTAPTSPSISIAVESDGSLRCVLDEEATDADGDALTYDLSWTVDEAAYADTTTTKRDGDTVSALEVVRGKSWQCSMAAYDGTEEGIAAVGTVTYTEPAEGEYAFETVMLAVSYTHLTLPTTYTV